MGISQKLAETKKRTLAEISPTTPSSKRQNTNKKMTEKVADMKIEDLQAMFAPLATKSDLAAVQQQVYSLTEQNKMLADKVEQLAEKCNVLESQMQSIYLWRNRNNLIVTMDKAGDLELAKTRVQNVFTSLAKENVMVERNLIRELKTSNKRKILFKVTLENQQILSKIIANTGSLKGTDVSISKDYTKAMRQKRGKLLMLRKFLMKSSNTKLKLQGSWLVDRDAKISWDAANGFIMDTGEPFASVLRKYGQTIENLQLFSAKQNINTTRIDNSLIRSEVSNNSLSSPGGATASNHV